MKQLVITLLLVGCSLTVQAQQTYDPGKLVKEKAEKFCELLAVVNLHPSEQKAVILHTEPKTAGVIIPQVDGYHVMVLYPYRADGTRWGCFFRDRRENGLLQLVEFGKLDDDQDNMRQIESFY